jgi:hypothetical protein
MNVREYLPEFVLIAIMAVSTFVVVVRLSHDVIVTIGIELLILCLGGLLLDIIMRLKKLEEQTLLRERSMRGNMEELARVLIQKQDTTGRTVIESVESIRSRMYR